MCKLKVPGISCLILSIFTLSSCNNHDITIKSFKDDKVDNDKLRCFFYFDNGDKIKEQCLFFTGMDAYAQIIINDKKNVLFPTADQTLTDAKYNYIEKFKNKDYELILKLHRPDSTCKHFKGIMIIINNFGDSVSKIIAGEFS